MRIVFRGCRIQLLLSLRLVSKLFFPSLVILLLFKGVVLLVVAIVGLTGNTGL